MRGNAQLWTLLHLRYTKHIFAGDGVPGGKNQLTGAAGEDIYIDVPLGTVAFRAEDHSMMGEITEDKQEIVLLKGGRGGKGHGLPQRILLVLSRCVETFHHRDNGHIIVITHMIIPYISIVLLVDTITIGNEESVCYLVFQ